MSARKGSGAAATVSIRVPPAAARALARLSRHVERALDPLDLSLPQYRVLSLLHDGSSASSALAGRLAVSPPSITAVVDGLVVRGLVARSADPDDRRRVHLELTEEGRRLLDEAEAEVNARLLAIAAFFDGDDPDAAVSTLRAWHTSLDGYRRARPKPRGEAATG
jgi:long-chain acyl-CoA synthetase